MALPSASESHACGRLTLLLSRRTVIVAMMEYLDLGREDHEVVIQRDCRCGGRKSMTRWLGRYALGTILLMMGASRGHALSCGARESWPRGQLHQKRRKRC